GPRRRLIASSHECNDRAAPGCTARRGRPSSAVFFRRQLGGIYEFLDLGDEPLTPRRLESAFIAEGSKCSIQSASAARVDRVGQVGVARGVYDQLFTEGMVALCNEANVQQRSPQYYPWKIGVGNGPDSKLEAAEGLTQYLDLSEAVCPGQRPEGA